MKKNWYIDSMCSKENKEKAKQLALLDTETWWNHALDIRARRMRPGQMDYLQQNYPYSVEAHNYVQDHLSTLDREEINYFHSKYNSEIVHTEFSMCQYFEPVGGQREPSDFMTSGTLVALDKINSAIYGVGYSSWIPDEDIPPHLNYGHSTIPDHAWMINPQTEEPQGWTLFVFELQRRFALGLIPLPIGQCPENSCSQDSYLHNEEHTFALRIGTHDLFKIELPVQNFHHSQIPSLGAIMRQFDNLYNINAPRHFGMDYYAKLDVHPIIYQEAAEFAENWWNDNKGQENLYYQSWLEKDTRRRLFLIDPIDIDQLSGNLVYRNRDINSDLLSEYGNQRIKPELLSDSIKLNNHFMTEYNFLKERIRVDDKDNSLVIEIEAEGTDEGSIEKFMERVRDFATRLDLQPLVNEDFRHKINALIDFGDDNDLYGFGSCSGCGFSGLGFCVFGGCLTGLIKWKKRIGSTRSGESPDDFLANLYPVYCKIRKKHNIKSLPSEWKGGIE